MTPGSYSDDRKQNGSVIMTDSSGLNNLLGFTEAILDEARGDPNIDYTVEVRDAGLYVRLSYMTGDKQWMLEKVIPLAEIFSFSTEAVMDTALSNIVGEFFNRRGLEIVNAKT